LLDVPLLFGVCLRTILKVGHCYGYALDRPSDKAWVLGALAVSLSSTRQKRTELMGRLREIEELMLEQTQQQIVVEEAAALITQIELFEDIPVFGAATGALLNLSVAHKTESTARRLFQERWLRDNAKVETIEPAPDGSIPAAQGWAGALARAGYGVVYNAAFGAVLPVALGCALLKPVAGPFRGLGRRSKRLVAAA
jgi:EcsC protein family